MVGDAPIEWRRGPRASFSLGTERGVYALFLAPGCSLSGITPGESGLVYIGKADGARGLKGRCHFEASTRNHSPRKTLAVLLMDELDLKPVLVRKPNSKNTWALDPTSERRLSDWMHANLELAVFACGNSGDLEACLVERLSPPMNLRMCVQTAAHMKISAGRSAVLAALEKPT